MANQFPMEVKVAWQDTLPDFEDWLIVGQQVNVYKTNQTEMARTRDVIWRPVRMQAYVTDGRPGTPVSFQSISQLSVPATLSHSPCVPFKIDMLEIRDEARVREAISGALRTLASEVNTIISTSIARMSTNVVTFPGNASGFDDIAACGVALDILGVPAEDRIMVLNSRDYHWMASDLQRASRSLNNTASTAALRAANLGEIAAFSTFKDHTGYTMDPATGGNTITMSTLSAAGNYHVPKSDSKAATGEVNNVDNRFQIISVSATASVKEGDAFTIDGVEAVHLISKARSGELKTFRVVEVVNGTTLRITPAIVSGQGGTDPEIQYQNTHVTPAANAAITWLNTTLTQTNLFWRKPAVDLLPGQYGTITEKDIYRRAVTPKMKLPIQIICELNHQTLEYDLRVDSFFGVSVSVPEHCGILLFNQQ